MDKTVLKAVVNVVFDWLETSQAGHPILLLVLRQLRKAVLANLDDVAAGMPPKVVAAFKKA